VMGPAVIESSATTLVVPPGAEVGLDQHRIFHLRHLA
jgi:acetone carboxylase, beta subunit